MSDKKEIIRRMDWDAKVFSKRKDTAREIIFKIMQQLKEKYNGQLDVAVDVGCGTGQSTIALAPFFNKVHGFDGIEAQIIEAKSARLLENIIYKVNPAESLPFEDNSVQLITAATSLHWFDLDKFFPESKRVLCNNGILAIYGYSRLKPLLNNSSAKAESAKLYNELQESLDPYFMPNAKLMYQNYQTINFPFEEVSREIVRGFFQGFLSDIIDHVSSYSSMKSFREHDPYKAEQTLNNFQKRLFEIAAKEDITPNETTTLFIDYALIICRNIKT